MPLPVDPAAERAALERQFVLLAPVVQELHAAAIAPSPLLSSGWRGPAAEAAERFVADLRAVLFLAEDAVEEVVAMVRSEIGRLG